MTTLNETITNLKNILATDWNLADFDSCPGITYYKFDMGSDIVYILTNSGDLLVCDTDICRINTSAEMQAAGWDAANVSEVITDALGITINDDWTISAA